MYDIIIVGGGPAGLTAALYARRANKTVAVIEKATYGGQITYSPKVENIPGFINVTGNEFAEKLTEQILEQGADLQFCEATAIQKTDGGYTVITDDGTFDGKTVILATGAKHRRLGLPHEEELIGNGISFCAVCDGAFFADQTVGVVGGGNSALQEALQLSELCKKVYIVQNLPYLTGEAKLCEQVNTKENIEVILGTTVKSLLGDDHLTGITVQSENGAETTLMLDGLFVAIGLLPQNEPFADMFPLDESGYVESDERCFVPNPGLFVAGDCRKKAIRQVTTAASDGAVAALAACRYLDEQV